jgi:3-phosphoshikimate 1-carboxyvinyltransferase
VVLPPLPAYNDRVNYPPQLPLTPVGGPVGGTARVPGSKSITNRALVLAALASRTGPCELTAALRSEDTEVMLDSLGRLGFAVSADWATDTVRVGRNASGRVIPAAEADLWVANSGTTVRFLTAMVSLGRGRYRLDGVSRMRERPIGALLDGLRQFGVSAVSEAGTDCPPVVIAASGWRPPEGGPVPGLAVVRADESSQFLSGLMLAAPFAGFGVDLFFDEGAVSRPYLDMTAAMLQAWGVRTDFENRSRTFRVGPHPHAHRPTYAVEPDASSASYFWAAAAVTGGRVTVPGLSRRSLQGDVGFVDLLARMGCVVTESDAGITVAGGPLTGIDCDMNAVSDTVMTLASVACFAAGPTRIRNVAHVRHKETDRIAAVAAELRKLGAGVDEHPDGLTVHPRPLTGCGVDTYKDHRMAMSLAVVGLRVPGVVIDDPGCVAKTYPGFWADWQRVTAP